MMPAAFTGDLRFLGDRNLFCLSPANTVAQAVLAKAPSSIGKVRWNFYLGHSPLAFGYSASSLFKLYHLVSSLAQEGFLDPSPLRLFSDTSPICSCLYLKLNSIFGRSSHAPKLSNDKGQGSCLISHA